MTNIRSLIGYIFLLAIACPAFAQNSETVSLVHKGLQRSYLLLLPESPLEKQRQYPLLLALHGGGGDPQNLQAVSELDSMAKSQRYILVYPAGTGPAGVFPLHKPLTWNAGNCCGYAVENKVDDVGFLSAVIEDVSKKFPVDPKRIYVTGHSNGAQMAYRLACELSEKIAAIAPVGALSAQAECLPPRKVPLIHFHGKLDRCASYQGGAACGDCYGKFLRAIGIPAKQRSFACEGVEESISRLAQRNGCSEGSETFFEQGAVNCRAYHECRNEADISYCTSSVMGHTWPGGKWGPVCNRPESMICIAFKAAVGAPDANFPVEKLMFDFFAAHKLP